jgi:hypothetical protein
MYVRDKLEERDAANGGGESQGGLQHAVIEFSTQLVLKETERAWHRDIPVSWHLVG